jgi:hypothetical protein
MWGQLVSDQSPQNESPDWLNAYEDLANDQLAHGSSCRQIHPIIETWFSKLMDGDPPASRDSVVQAISCLATEVLYSSPESVIEPMLKEIGEDDLAIWIEQILLIGRSFEIALREGELDDL